MAYTPRYCDECEECPEEAGQVFTCKYAGKVSRDDKPEDVAGCYYNKE